MARIFVTALLVKFHNGPKNGYDSMHYFQNWWRCSHSYIKSYSYALQAQRKKLLLPTTSDQR